MARNSKAPAAHVRAAIAAAAQPKMSSGSKPQVAPHVQAAMATSARLAAAPGTSQVARLDVRHVLQRKATTAQDLAPAASPARHGVVQPSYYRTEDLEAVGEAVGTALRPLFGVEDDPTNPFEDMVHGLPWWRRWQLGNRGLVDLLFQRFCAYGFRYHVGMAMSVVILGTHPGHRATDLADGYLEGNCIAFANAFATILSHFNIRAEAREVRRTNQAKFITKVVRNFIDQRATGNIRYKNGGIIPGRYLFSNHTATYVPSLGLYYDPMICESYANFSSKIDQAWALTAMDDSGDRYWLAQNHNGANAVVRRSSAPAPGFPSTWQLVKRKRKKRH